MCARLNRCQSTTSFFFFPISPVVTTSPSQHPNKKNTPLFDSASTSHTSGKLFMALSFFFFFFYSGAPSAQMAPRKKKSSAAGGDDADGRENAPWGSSLCSEHRRKKEEKKNRRETSLRKCLYLCLNDSHVIRKLQRFCTGGSTCGSIWAFYHLEDFKGKKKQKRLAWGRLTSPKKKAVPVAGCVKCSSDQPLLTPVRSHF